MTSRNQSQPLAEPDVDKALARLGETANRIADERNTYLAAARVMLAALRGLKDDIGVVKLGNDNFKRYEKLKKQTHAAIRQAEAAGIE